jgi:hypothetical protein
MKNGPRRVVDPSWFGGWLNLHDLDACFSRLRGRMEGNPMDVAYVALFVLFWLLLAGMAVGCDKLKGANK